jgi:hypothetical protein
MDVKLDTLKYGLGTGKGIIMCWWVEGESEERSMQFYQPAGRETML